MSYSFTSYRDKMTLLGPDAPASPILTFEISGTLGVSSFEGDTHFGIRYGYSAFRIVGQNGFGFGRANGTFGAGFGVTLGVNNPTPWAGDPVYDDVEQVENRGRSRDRTDPERTAEPGDCAITEANETRAWSIRYRRKAPSMSDLPDETGREFVACPGCGARLPRQDDGFSNPLVNASAECQRSCHELSLHTLPQGDAFFIHQVTVDAYAAQHAGPASKPIAVAFGLIGLCLLLERGHTGRAVQRAHMRLASRSKRWPPFDPPVLRGIVTVADIPLDVPDHERDAAIMRWASSVWTAWEHAHPAVRSLIDQYDRR